MKRVYKTSKKRRDYQNRYYQENRKRILASIDKEKNRHKNKMYYIKNRIKEINRIKAYLKEKNYAPEKSPKQKRIRGIKRMTRRKYPLFKVLKCELCDNGATEHHHNTTPIQIDKFNFVCHDCHTLLNSQPHNNYKEV